MANHIASVDLDDYASSWGESLASEPILTHQQQYIPLASLMLALPRTACIAGVGLMISLSPVTAIPDVWSDERRRRDTATLIKVFDMPIGRPISRRQALLLARQILHQAEQNRAIFAVSEAQRGIHWEEEQ